MQLSLGKGVLKNDGVKGRLEWRRFACGTFAVMFQLNQQLAFNIKENRKATIYVVMNAALSLYIANRLTHTKLACARQLPN